MSRVSRSPRGPRIVPKYSRICPKISTNISGKLSIMSVKAPGSKKIKDWGRKKNQPEARSRRWSLKKPLRLRVEFLPIVSVNRLCLGDKTR